MDRPVCGRRMLKVEMEIHQVHQGWLFNIGDSQSNDGWGKFSSRFRFLNELHVQNVYKKLVCLILSTKPLDVIRHVTITQCRSV